MRVVVAVADLIARSRVESAARRAGLAFEGASVVPDEDDGACDLLIVDLDQPDALARIARWRTTHPDTPVTGFAFHVNADTIKQARAVGVRVVAHGADPSTLFGNPATGHGV